jgi:hypothetical protein
VSKELEKAWNDCFCVEQIIAGGEIWSWRPTPDNLRAWVRAEIREAIRDREAEILKAKAILR